MLRIFCTSSPSQTLRHTHGGVLIAASIIGSLSLGWIAGRIWTHRELKQMSEVQVCRSLGLLTPAQAQHTEVVRLDRLLSDEETAEVLSFARTFWERQLPGHEESDLQRQARAKGPSWRTTYLHAGDAFAQKFPTLLKRLRGVLLETDAQHWQVLKGREPSRLNFRTIECHEYAPSGQLTASRHYDAGSLLTLDIMLSHPNGDFKGGQLVTPEPDGSLRPAEMRKGEAVVFLSHKYHNVLPVLEGERAVLILELWDGPKRTCPHRCRSVGPCERSIELAFEQRP